MRNRRLAALLALLAITVSAAMWAGDKKKDKKNKKTAIAAAAQMDEHQRALHVLNRFTFGPRPGEVDQVAAAGVDKWFDAQLRPEKLDDTQVEARLSPLRTLHMSSIELVQNFPPPQVIKAAEQGRVAIPNDPVKKAIFEAQIEKYEKQQEQKQAKGNDAAAEGQDPQMMTEEQQAERREARMYARDQAEKILALPPDKRFQAILQMPADKRQVFSRALNPEERDQVLNSLTPQQREQVMAMNNPQQVVVTELMQAKLLRDAYSERQLQEVMTDFWYNHFNVFVGKGADRYLITEYENKVIRPRAMGKFKDLLLATAQSPAMLFYLDNWQSVGPNSMAGTGQRPNAQNRPFMRPNGRFGGRRMPVYMPQQPRPQQQPQQQQGNQPKRGLNENYAREIMELHTLGVEGGYTQKDVTELARVLTGWTIRDPRRGGEFFFNERMHESGTKSVLGHSIHENGEKEGLEMIELLAHHPSTAHFISKKLAMRFVSDNPPDALVERMSQTFLNTDGDIREVLRTMYQSPEFWSPQTVRAKVKTPLEFIASAVRATGADVSNAMPLVQTLNQMGMPLYGAQPPTGYSMKAETWVNSAALLIRMNFALRFTSGRMPGVQFAPEKVLGGESPGDVSAAIARLEQALLSGEVSQQTHQTILKQMNDPQVTGRMLDDPTRSVNVGVIAGLILGSPEFQRR
jgi:uncharacterized protein (DUF1800 family)